METSLQLSEEMCYEKLLNQVKQIFDLLDVSDNTREEYRQRIKLFLIFIKKNGFNINCFLEFKRFLRERIDYSTSTKNKYLATSRVFLKELNRLPNNDAWSQNNPFLCIFFTVKQVQQQFRATYSKLLFRNMNRSQSGMCER